MEEYDGKTAIRQMVFLLSAIVRRIRAARLDINHRQRLNMEVAEGVSQRKE